MIPGGGDHRRVEGTRDRNGPSLNSLIRQAFDRLLYAPTGAGDDRLAGGIDVRSPDTFDRLQDVGDALRTLRHSGHRAEILTRRLDNTAAPSLGNSVQGLL